MRRTYSHIDLDERRRIARWRSAGLPFDLIAEKLGRRRSTIFRELKRNMFVDAAMSDLNGCYRLLRLRKARAMIMNTSTPIVDVAKLCGFPSSSHFSKCFRAAFARTPTQERNSSQLA
jgi:transcriptional regulator GlxA family with amidase domain